MIDINVWLALTWDQHPQHLPAARWYGSVGAESLLFCRFTMLGYLRLLTNRQVMGDSTRSLAEALELYDRWNADPRVELAPEPKGAELVFRKIVRPILQEPATKAIADCYLAAFAGAAGGYLVTLDKGLAGLARRERIPFVLIRPAGATAGKTMSPKRAKHGGTTRSD